MKEILVNIKTNKWLILLCLMMVFGSTAISPYFFYGYMLSILYVFVFKYRHATFSFKYATLFVLFIGSCFLSILGNFVINYRLFMFSFMLLITGPFFFSIRNIDFERKILKYSLLIYPLISLICLYCYYAGINFYSYKDNSIEWDFSAIYGHPLWLGASAGLANIVICWLVFNVTNGLLKYLFLVLLLCSILLSVVAASRSALVASLLVIVFYVYYKTTNVKRFFKYIVLIIGLSIILLPLYYDKAGRMIAKFEFAEKSGLKYGSRDELFSEGIENFVVSPIVGSGFATSYRGGKLLVGRIESGSGWLSVLFQLGIIGTLIMAFIVLKVLKIYRYLRKDRWLQLFFIAFVYMCFHSLFEGYILTTGYNLSFLFWLIIGHIISYQTYLKYKKK